MNTLLCPHGYVEWSLCQACSTFSYNSQSPWLARLDYSEIDTNEAFLSELIEEAPIYATKEQSIVGLSESISNGMDPCTAPNSIAMDLPQDFNGKIAKNNVINTADQSMLHEILLYDDISATFVEPRDVDDITQPWWPTQLIYQEPDIRELPPSSTEVWRGTQSVEAKREGAASNSRMSSGTARDMSNLYHCTVFPCRSSFKRSYEWKRHESSKHFLMVKWTCMHQHSFIQDQKCVFCAEPYPDFEHLSRHGVEACLRKRTADRTFGRKDHLKQHVQQVHLAAFDKAAKKNFAVPRSWRQEADVSSPDPRSLWCGFCQQSFDSWEERFSHVVSHFEDGAVITDWQPYSSV